MSIRFSDEGWHNYNEPPQGKSLICVSNIRNLILKHIFSNGEVVDCRVQLFAQNKTANVEEVGWEIFPTDKINNNCISNKHKGVA